MTGVAKLAYMTFPAPGVFIFNYQIGEGELQRIEISRAHAANIVIDCTSVALREYSSSQIGDRHERDSAGDRPQQHPSEGAVALNRGAD